MNNKDSDSAWTKSWCCTHSLHSKCQGCRCKKKNHVEGSNHPQFGYFKKRHLMPWIEVNNRISQVFDEMELGGKGSSLRQSGGSPMTAMISPALHVEQVWNPYDNKWERL